MKKIVAPAEALDNFIDRLAENPYAASPSNMDPQSGSLVRSLYRLEQGQPTPAAASMAEIQARVWQKALSSAQIEAETPAEIFYLNPAVRQKSRFALTGLGLVASLAFIFLALSVLFVVFSGGSGASNPIQTDITKGYVTVFPQATPNLTPLPAIAAVTGRITSFDGPVVNLAWSPDGKYLAVATPHKLYLQDSAGKTFKSLDRTDNLVKVKWAPDSQTLATLSQDDSGKVTTVRLWQINQPIDKPFIDSPSPVTDLAWKPDGQRLLTLSQDKGLRFWNLNGQIIINRVTGDGLIGLSPDGKYVAVSSSDGKISYYDAFGLEDGEKVAFRFSMGGSTNLQIRITSLAWSNDGQVLAIGYKESILFMDKVGTITKQIELETGTLASLVWSPDGKYLAGGSDNNQLNLWQVNGETIQAYAPLTRHSGPITSVAWSPDGKTLATGSADHSVVEWAVPPPPAK